MLCDFSAGNQCRRCGFIAPKSPMFRHCQTIEEAARESLEKMAATRIRVPPMRIGAAVAGVLKRIGVTEDRVKKLIGKDCGCSKRANKLDAVGESISMAAERGLNKALDVILPHPVTDQEVAALAQAMLESPLTNAGLKQKYGPS